MNADARVMAFDFIMAPRRNNNARPHRPRRATCEYDIDAKYAQGQVRSPMQTFSIVRAW
jgi:hypothetical protein